LLKQKEGNMRSFLSLVFLCSTLWATDSLAVKNTGLPVGSKAPGCYAKTLDGKDFFLSRYVGPRARQELSGPVAFSFFTTFCVPCRNEIPYLHTLKKEYPALNIYMINIREDPKIVRSFAEKMNYTLPILLDRYGKIAENYSAVVTPTLVLIDKDGKIAFYKRGFEKSDTTLIANQFKRLSEKQD